MWRKALGILGGVATGMAVTTVAETIEGLLHPIPESVNPLNVESYALIARRTALWPAVVAGVVLFFFGAINVIALPHPAWFIGLDLACCIPLAWLGARLVAARAQPASPAGPAGT